MDTDPKMASKPEAAMRRSSWGKMKTKFYEREPPAADGSSSGQRHLPGRRGSISPTPPRSWAAPSNSWTPFLPDRGHREEAGGLRRRGRCSDEHGQVIADVIAKSPPASAGGVIFTAKKRNRPMAFVGDGVPGVLRKLQSAGRKNMCSAAGCVIIRQGTRPALRRQWSHNGTSRTPSPGKKAQGGFFTLPV